jgi:hypothetical protein
MEHSEPISPQMQRSLEATERWWNKMDEEFGLLSSGEVILLLGRPIPEEALSVLRHGEVKYPGYQFDVSSQKVFPSFSAIVRSGRQYGWGNESIAMWMICPTIHLGGLRPVDCITDAERIQRVAQDSFDNEW